MKVRNTTSEKQELWLEPFGDRVFLNPGLVYEVTATDELEEIDFSNDGFRVHGWIVRVEAVSADGSTETVWDDQAGSKQDS